MSANQEIKGNTLKIYLYLLRHGPSELRDIQRGTGLSSPSLVSYHLGKLSEAGFANQDEYGKYFAVKETSDKVLEGYLKMGPAIVPQMFFFALLFTILVAFFAFMALSTPAFTIYLAVVCSAMILIFWYETVRLWRKLAA
jgi:DNA-binding transcriptional ArsR family regulator